MGTRWQTLALGGLVAATLGACGGGTEDACPTGAPVVELVGFEWSPMPGEEHLPEANLLEHVVDLRFEVTNHTAAPIDVESVDLVVGLENEAIDWRRDAPRVAAGDTVTLDAQVVSLFQAVNAREPSAEQIEVAWRWEGPERRDCATPRARVQPTAGDDPAPATTTPIPTMPAPQAPPDALAIGDTATFALPSGQEVRLTVTSASTTGACPEPGAPPPSVGHLFVGLRLEVGPGGEPWRVHATSMNVGPAAAPSVTDAAGPCIGASSGYNDLQAGPGQTAEATFVFDGLGPSIWYTFDAYGLDEPQRVAWAI